jgi:hypothetical protein
VEMWRRMVAEEQLDDDSVEACYLKHGTVFCRALTSTAARAKLRPRAKRQPQFDVGLADSLGAIIVQRVQEARPAVVLLELV